MQTVSTTISAMKARRNFGEIINRALYGGETFLVERGGEPVVKIEAINPKARTQRGSQEFWKLVEQVRAQTTTYPEQQVREDIEQAIEEVRTEERAQMKPQ